MTCIAWLLLGRGAHLIAEGPPEIISEAEGSYTDLFLIKAIQNKTDYV